jgi:hypothetical protein
MKKIVLIFLLLASQLSFSQTFVGQAADSVAQYAQTGQEVVDNLQTELAYIRGLVAKVKELNNYTEYLSLESVKTLPVSISKMIGGQRYDIIIDQAYFTPYGAEISAKFLFVIPKTGDSIFFKANGIPLHQGGLAKDVTMSLLYAPAIALSDKMSIQLVPDLSGTYVKFNCDGYQGMGISARVNFSTDMIVADPGNGSKGSDPVYATFSTSFEEWGEFTAELTFSSAFQVCALKGVGISVYNAVIDLSDLNTPGSVVFPSQYVVNDRQLWQGVFIKEFSVSLPRQFKKRSTTERITFSGYNILIDALGLTGQFASTGSLIPLHDGDMDGWDFSLDSIGVSFVASRISGAGFRGEIQIPLRKTGDIQELSYQADIYSGDEYLFNVVLGNSMEIDIWKAHLSLNEGSSFEVAIQEDKFLPKAILHGNLTVDAPKLKLNQIFFEGLVLQTVEPYVSATAFDLSSSNPAPDDQKMSNFPVTLSGVGLRDLGDGMYGISVQADIHLCQGGGNSFSGTTGFMVIGKVSKSPKFSFEYDRLQLNNIGLDITSGAFSLKGVIVSYNDHEVYGQGFKGMVQAYIVDAFSADVTVQFGNVNNYRYWYFDGSFVLPVGVTVFTGLDIYGFGGGAYQRMRREVPSGEPKLENPDANTVKKDNSLEPGVTLSGVRYIPDPNMGLGLKASVIFGSTGKPNPYNGELGLEVAFTTDGGVGMVGINGRLLFTNPIEERFSENVPIKATIDITYYVQEKTLSCGAEVMVNLPSGVKGGGQLSIYVSPSTWYYYVGHPNNRLSLNLMGIADITSYMMIGNKIPPMPTLPEIILRNLQVVDQRNETDMRDGKGFCFGASLDFDSGDQEFLCFYATFSVLAGFDVMLKHYEEGEHCQNTGLRPGFKGFYAHGQLYAYLQGNVGIKVHIFGADQKYQILDVGAGVVFQAKAPKPNWLKGVVAGHYSILDGLIEGDCRFELELGERCDMSTTNLVSNVKIISSVTPGDRERTEVFTAPRAALSLAEGKPYVVTDDNGNMRRFSVKVAYFKVLDGTAEIKGVMQYNTKKDVISFIPHEILPPQKTLTLKVKAYFVEHINGIVTPYKVNGTPVEEEVVTTFTTGEAPNYVPSSNVVYSYPMNGQYNFYKNEYNQAYIQLQMGQKYLFGDQVDKTRWRQLARITSANSIVEIPFTYNEGAKKIEFTLTEYVATNTAYKFQIVNLPVSGTSGQDSGRDTSRTSYNEGQVNIRNNTLTGNQTTENAIEIFALIFRTSRYNTFPEKMQSLALSNPTNWVISPGVSQVSMQLKGTELMDAFELSGNNNSNIRPLIQLASQQNASWFTYGLKPLMYNSYPIDNVIKINTRDTSVLGLVPVKAVYLQQSNNNKVLTASEAESGTASNIGGLASVVYDVSFFASQDYGDLREQCAARLTYTQNPSASLVNIVNSNYPNVTQGQYTVRAVYVLPGLGQVTSTYPLVLVNP